MASEIKINTSATLVNGSLKSTWSPGQIAITQSTASRSAGTESLTTSESTLTIPTTGGILFMQNIGTTNACYFGASVAGPAMATSSYMAAGDIGLFRTTSGVAFRARAAASTTSLLWEFWQV